MSDCVYIPPSLFTSYENLKVLYGSDKVKLTSKGLIIDSILPKVTSKNEIYCKLSLELVLLINDGDDNDTNKKVGKLKKINVLKRRGMNDFEQINLSNFLKKMICDKWNEKSFVEIVEDIREYITKEVNVISKKSCPICLEKFKKKSKIIKFGKCLHVFHKMCIYSWFGGNYIPSQELKRLKKFVDFKKHKSIEECKNFLEHTSNNFVFKCPICRTGLKKEETSEFTIFNHLIRLVEREFFVTDYEKLNEFIVVQKKKSKKIIEKESDDHNRKVLVKMYNISYRDEKTLDLLFDIMRQNKFSVDKPDVVKITLYDTGKKMELRLNILKRQFVKFIKMFHNQDFLGLGKIFSERIVE